MRHIVACMLHAYMIPNACKGCILQHVSSKGFQTCIKERNGKLGCILRVFIIFLSVLKLCEVPSMDHSRSGFLAGIMNLRIIFL